MKSPHDFPAINPKRPDGIKPNGIPYKVMVIDDKEFHRKQIIQILESEGYEIIAAASNGAEALKLYDHGCDLDLYNDMVMPKLDGYALSMN
jgi:two-component system chemotaxis response regulator CheY